MSTFFCSGALAVPFFTCAEFYYYTWQCIFKLGHIVTLKQSFIQDFLLWDGDLMLGDIVNVCNNHSLEANLHLRVHLVKQSNYLGMCKPHPSRGSGGMPPQNVYILVAFGC